MVVAAAVVLVLGLLIGVIVGHAQTPPTVTTTGTEHVYLTVSFNPYSDLDQYFPANFTVTANIPVIITITNYDNGSNPVPQVYANVTGTVGGTETISNATTGGATVTQVSPEVVAHTFTILQSPYGINVPVPAAEGTVPTVVTFTVVFPTAGNFVWRCMAPCDDVSMVTPGFMMGTVTVVNA